MAFTRTTLAAAAPAGATSIVVASATGFAAGSAVRIDQEIYRVGSAYVSGTTIPVIPGQDGTASQAHVITAGVVVGLTSDFANQAPQTVVTYPIAGRAVQITSYTTAGALTLPTSGSDVRAILNSTVALAMTLAVPTVDLDGSILTVVGNGKAAHTVTVAGGIGAGSTGYTVLTFDTNAQCCVSFIAANAVWVPYPSPFSGTLTGVDVAVA